MLVTAHPSPSRGSGIAGRVRKRSGQYRCGVQRDSVFQLKSGAGHAASWTGASEDGPSCSLRAHVGRVRIRCGRWGVWSVGFRPQKGRGLDAAVGCSKPFSTVFFTNLFRKNQMRIEDPRYTNIKYNASAGHVWGVPTTMGRPLPILRGIRFAAIPVLHPVKDSAASNPNSPPITSRGSSLLP